MILTIEKITKIIESDFDSNGNGRFSKDFRAGLIFPLMDFVSARKLEAMLGFSSNEMVWDDEYRTININIVADDDRQLLIKETNLYKDELDHLVVEWWIVNKTNLLGDVIWTSWY